MRYTVIIDDKSKTGAGLLEVARSIAKTYKSVKVINGVSEDEWIVTEIEKAKKSGKADKQKLLERFNSE